MSKRRVLFYCQHLLGVGHLTRSYAIVNRLCESFDVLFVQGGPDIGRLPDTRVKLLQLAPLQMREEDSSLYDPVADRSPEEVFAARWAQLGAEVFEKFDFYIVELYPFGRKKMREEIRALGELLKKKNPALKTLCSLRDIMVEKKNQADRDQKTLEEVKKYYDYVLVHSDPRVVKLEETFAPADEIKDRIHYTGFVTEYKTTAQPASTRKKRILVSQGGGIVGGELLIATAALADTFSDYQFDFVLGPNAPKDLRNQLLWKLNGRKNAAILPFMKNFEIELAKSAFSISLAGYNTVMNVLNTQTPALLYPYLANQEQALRASKLEMLGLAGTISKEDFEPSVLEKKIRSLLSGSYPAVAVDLDGAENTRKFLAGLSGK